MQAKLLLRLAGSLFAFLLTLEVCARLDDAFAHGAPLWGVYNQETLYTWDHLGKRGRPNARYQKWKFNSLGLRGPDLQAGRYRIACIGASETFGLFESPGGEWPRQLEAQLNSQAGQSSFEVVNTAYPGMTLSTTLLRLPEYLQTLKPQMVVIYPSLANYIWLPYLRPFSGKPPPEQKFELRIVERARTTLKNSVPESVLTQIREWETEKGAQRFESVMKRLPEENVTRFHKDLLETVQRIRASGAQPVLVTHATRFGPRVQPADREFLTAWRKFYPMLHEDGFLDMEARLNQAIRRLGASEGALVIDAAAELSPGPSTFVESVHFTDRGSREMARIVANGLAPLLPGPKKSSVQSVSASRR